MMPEDLKELLRAFNDHGVKYLIVGGYALGVHAEPRATKDLNIFIRPDEENSKAVFRALAQYGAPLENLTPSDFMDGTTFQIGRPPARIEPRLEGPDIAKSPVFMRFVTELRLLVQVPV